MSKFDIDATDKRTLEILSDPQLSIQNRVGLMRWQLENGYTNPVTIEDLISSAEEMMVEKGSSRKFGVFTRTHRRRLTALTANAYPEQPIAFAQTQDILSLTHFQSLLDQNLISRQDFDELIHTWENG